MRKIFYIFCIVVLVSCEPIDRDENKGQIILSSAFDFNNYTILGYNFELRSFTQFPSGPDPLPDIILEKFTRVSGDILPGFNSPGNNNGFALIRESINLEESAEFFDSYREFDTALQLSPTTDTVRNYQVWVLKTGQNKFVKINVRDIRILKNVAGEYLEVSLDYYYQDDGTAVFPK